MNDDRSLLVRGIASVKAGEIDEARKYLEWALRRYPARDVEFDVYLWLAKVEPDPVLQRDHLESALAIDPLDPRARRALAVLDGKLNPGEIIDPDNLPPVIEGEGASAELFDCPSCGGRMHYSADGQSLICEYCEMTAAEGGSQEGAIPDEQDFILGLATIKGHTKKVKVRSFACEACGANFLLAPEALTLNCHHCGSKYVVSETETSTWIAPQGVIPFAITQRQAGEAALMRLLDTYRIKPKIGDPPPLGVYMPAWTFDIGGAITWRGFDRDDDGIPRPAQGCYPVAIDDLLIAASDRISDLQQAALEQFDLRSTVPYDPSYLVDWPAETYQIKLSQAALAAREKAYDSLKPAVARITRSLNASLSSAQMSIISYKLILLPIWSLHIKRPEQEIELVINGQTGMVMSEQG